jgi:hypothetical protein
MKCMGRGAIRTFILSTKYDILSQDRKAYQTIVSGNRFELNLIQSWCRKALTRWSRRISQGSDGGQLKKLYSKSRSE